MGFVVCPWRISRYSPMPPDRLFLGDSPVAVLRIHMHMVYKMSTRNKLLLTNKLNKFESLFTEWKAQLICKGQIYSIVTWVCQCLKWQFLNINTLRNNIKEISDLTVYQLPFNNKSIYDLQYFAYQLLLIPMQLILFSFLISFIKRVQEWLLPL